MKALQKFELDLDESKRKAMVDHIKQARDDERRLYPELSSERLLSPISVSKQLADTVGNGNPERIMQGLLNLHRDFNTLRAKTGEPK